MINFHRVDINDMQWIKSRLSCKSKLSCEYSFGNIFAYNAKIDVWVADHNEFLIVKYVVGDCNIYAYPIGAGDVKPVLKAIIEDAKDGGKKAVIAAMAREDAEYFNQIFGNEYKVSEERDAFDYVYDSENLINLTGKKYQPKRNHISFFKRTYDWSYEKITRDNIPECIEMNRKWLDNYDPELREPLIEEFNIIKLVFDNYETLGFVGGLIRVDGKVVAYTMGEHLDSDTFCVHFEKAFSDIRGAYPIINQQFVENELSGYKYINREDDVGAENLRKAKLSYHPAFMFEKYTAQIN
ncbi:MAG: phosphatidylglycerol lysyltransferase domain-containing protein [Faecalibacterium sp.]|nr:phosphatidylglycerol lysyltransferase domain-containing protein [Ruminococcus sp.]MCM1391679.1 phosphatidylglycerol lysyltransferase domain-containing protein [Ruminococcus sp.]MCM1485979.1 phosphatidylglycerol lysyltransferase domain-containing protein [Faecalibacterium sp.]